MDQAWIGLYGSRMDMTIWIKDEWDDMNQEWIDRVIWIKNGEEDHELRMIRIMLVNNGKGVMNQERFGVY